MLRWLALFLLIPTLALAQASVNINPAPVNMPAANSLLLSNGPGTQPSGLAPSGTNCAVSSGGAWTTGSCGGGGSSGALPAAGCGSGQWYTGFVAGTKTTMQLAANRAYYIPFVPMCTGTLTSLGVNVQGVDGNGCRFAAFSWDATNSVPLTKIAESPSSVSVSGTGFVSSTGLSIPVTIGTMYALMVNCGGTPTLVAVPVSNSLLDAILGNVAPGSNGDQNYGAITYGAYPTTFPAITHNNGNLNQPLVWIK